MRWGHKRILPRSLNSRYKWRLIHKGRWSIWVWVVIRIVKLHHLIVVHRIHVLQVLLIVVPGVPVFVLEVLPRPGPLFVPLPMIEGILPMPLILYHILMVFVYLRGLDWHLSLFVLIRLRGLWLLNLAIFVILRLNRLYLILIQYLSSLHVVNLFANEILVALEMLFWLYCIKWALYFAENVHHEPDEVLVFIAYPPVKVYDLVGLFKVGRDD